MARNMSIIKGKVRVGEDMIPFEITWNISLDIYRLHCETPTTASPEDAFCSAREALDYLLENFAEWSA